MPFDTKSDLDRNSYNKQPKLLLPYCVYILTNKTADVLKHPINTGSASDAVGGQNVI